MIEPTDIAGVILRRLTTNADDRGALTEVFRQEWLPEGAPPMPQANLSGSHAGVLRGMHFHRRQADYWCVLDGTAFIALYDLRPDSGTTRALAAFTVDTAEGHLGLYIPPGVAHGFCALTDMHLQYFVDAYFDGTDEFGFAWNDPQAAIPWPVSEPKVSARDSANPSLTDAMASW